MLSVVTVMEMSFCSCSCKVCKNCSVDGLVKVVLQTAVPTKGRIYLYFQGSGSMAVDEVLEFWMLKVVLYLLVSQCLVPAKRALVRVALVHYYHF